MAVHSRRDLQRFTPSWREAEETPPVYLIAPLTWLERTDWQADLIEAGCARVVMPANVVAVVRAALQELQPDNVEDLIAEVDAFAADLASPIVVPPAGDDEADAEAASAHAVELEARTRRAVAYQAVEAAVSAHPDVAKALADQHRFRRKAPGLAAARALRGWEGVDLPFRRVGGVVPGDLLERLPPADLEAIGWRAMELMRPSETDRKN